ncbi:MAG: maltose/maltodextrin ABC transporter substrate-binding protein MalE [Thermotogota bacterium]
MKKLIVLSLVALFATVAVFANSIVVWSSEQQVDFMRRIGEEFARDTGINVEVEQVNFGDIKSKFLTAAPAGEGPDIIVGAHDWVGELVDNGLIEPIPTSAVETDKYADSGINAFTWNGQLYGLPYAIESVSVYYNKDYVEEVPSNIEDFKAIAKEYTTDETVGFIYRAEDFYFSSTFIQGKGGYVFDWSAEDGYDVNDIGLNNEGAIAGAEIIESFYEEGIIPQGANYDTMNSMFKEGLAAMILNGPWAAKEYLDAGIDYGVFPVTELDLGDGDTGKPFVGVQGLMVNARSENKAFATEFVVNYLATQEGIYNFYIADPRLPAREDVSEVIAERGGPIPEDIVSAFQKAAAGGVPMPSVPEMAPVWSAMEEAILNIISGNQEVQPALDDAVNKITTAISE